MKILITGAKGFIGRNLIARLEQYGNTYEVYQFDIDSTREDLNNYTKDCDFVFNFAAVHRPKDASEFDQVNHVFFDDLLSMLRKHGNTCPVLYTSSIQATNGTDYGNSKLASENDLLSYGAETGARAIVYRLSNTYGRWATPNHHSVVATFCHNIALGLPIVVNDPAHVMNFHYIDDVIDSFISQLTGTPLPDDDGIFRLPKSTIHVITLGELAETLQGFKAAIDDGRDPVVENETQRTLLCTFRSYLP